MPEVHPGDDLASLILDALPRNGLTIDTGDVLVVTQKVVSKAEGQLVDLETVTPSAFAAQIAQTWDKDARLVELVLRESRRIVRMDRGILITETLHGFVCANSGIDQSNVPGNTVVSLLPKDSDASASGIRAAIAERTGADIAVIVSDTFGRPWRMGNTDVALGVAGFDPLQDYQGVVDPYGYTLRVSVSAVADQLAGAAELVMPKISGIPTTLIRGFPFTATDGNGQALIREAGLDLFR